MSHIKNQELINLNLNSVHLELNHEKKLIRSVIRSVYENVPAFSDLENQINNWRTETKKEIDSYDCLENGKHIASTLFS